MRAWTLPILLLIVSCGPTADLPATPRASAPTEVRASTSPTPTPSPLAGSAVEVTVEGRTVLGSEQIGASGDLPTVVLITFPFEVDRTSVDPFLPPQASREWVDGRNLRLSFAKPEPEISFKVAGAKALAGDAQIGHFVVNVTFPQSRIADIYTVADLTTGARVPEPTTSVRLPGGDGVAVSPDAKSAIVFDGFGPGLGPRPTLVDIATGGASPLAVPASDGWFAFAGWLRDGRLVLVGRGVWVGESDGVPMRRIADTQAAAVGYPWLAVPDPQGTRIAIWGYNEEGRIAVIDLQDGSIRRLTGPFRRPCEDCSVSLTWSSDGRSIAGTDSDYGTGPSTERVRVVDVGSDRTVRTLEGEVRGLFPLGGGEFVVSRDSGVRGQGAPNLGIRMGFDLVEKARYLGCAWFQSPDGRYLLQSECSAAGMPSLTLIDQRTGSTNGFGLPAYWGTQWLDGGRLASFQ